MKLRLTSSMVYGASGPPYSVAEKLICAVKQMRSAVVANPALCSLLASVSAPSEVPLSCLAQTGCSL